MVCLVDKENTIKKRISEIDVAKGVVILLMVLGHSGIPNSIINIIYAFHMPFFFFIFGFTTNFEVETISYIKRKSFHLLIPFGIYACLNIFLRSFYYETTPYSYVITHLYLGCESPLWFVPILFFSAVLSKFILQYSKSLVVVLILLFLQSLINIYAIKLPWSLSILPISTVFVLCGFYYKCKNPNYPNCNKKNILSQAICYLSSMLFVIVVSNNFRLEMKDNTSTEPLNILFITAIVGCLVCMRFVTHIKLKPLISFFQFFGKNTFLIMAFSGIIIKYLNLFHFNAVVKYILLFAILIVMIVLKNKISLSKKLNL